MRIVMSRVRDEPKPRDYATSTDGESEVEQIEVVVDMAISARTNSETKNLHKFLDNAEFVTNSGDPRTNIVYVSEGKSYNIPPTRISSFFNLLEGIRRDNVPYLISERQYTSDTTHSGIMLDFDIHQTENRTRVTTNILRKLIREIFRMLHRYVSLPTPFNTIVGVTRKPRVLPKSVPHEMKTIHCFKDGFHILIPGIQVTSRFKKFLVDKLISEEVYVGVLADIKPAETFSPKDFLDRGCASVPVFFVGSSSKIGAPPYEIADNIFDVTIERQADSIEIDVSNNESMIDNKQVRTSVNVSYEFALSFARESAHGIIKKVHYEPRDEHAPQVTSSIMSVRQLGDLTRLEQEIAMLKKRDHEAELVEQLLETISAKRSDDRNMWRDVLYALAHKSSEYKPLAEKFSRLSPKFDMPGFEAMWEQALNCKTANPLTINSLHAWARDDNKAKYELVRAKDLYTFIYEAAYTSYNRGKMSDRSFAEIVHRVVCSRYKTDHEPGSRSISWYEFVVGDAYVKPRPGELYKWRKWNEAPYSLSNILSIMLPPILTKVADRIKERCDEAIGSPLHKYHGEILKNFHASIHSLGNVMPKERVMRETAIHFYDRGFSELLDMDPFTRGVGNGIIRYVTKWNQPTGMYPRVELVTGFNQCNVSKYTVVDYKPFDPTDPITKQLLLALRDVFPDNEQDSFEYIMMYLASVLDGRAKECIILMMIGGGANGKSMLMEMLKATIGKHSVKMPLEFLTGKRTSAENATPALMNLIGATLAYYSESNQAEILNVARMKELISGETMAGRKLFGDLTEFKPKCHHIVTSNYPLSLQGASDYGTTRRIRLLNMKVSFMERRDPRFDPNNPNHRIAKPEINTSWNSDPRYLSAFMGILVFYWCKLQKIYGGMLANINAPHLEHDTLQFIRKQDSITNFLVERLVRLSSDESEKEIPLTDFIAKYRRWYTEKYSDAKPVTDDISSQFENSRIRAYMSEHRGAFYVKGYRVLGDSKEMPGDGEEFAHMDAATSVNVVTDNYNIPVENSEQFYERVCTEYEEYREACSGVVLSEASPLRRNDIEIGIRKPYADNTFCEEKMRPPEMVVDNNGIVRVKPQKKKLDISDFIDDSEDEVDTADVIDDLDDLDEITNDEQ